MRAVMNGTTSVLCLGRETLDTMRMKRQEVDSALLQAEDYIDKQGVPQIDFVMMNENGMREKENDKVAKLNDQIPISDTEVQN